MSFQSLIDLDRQLLLWFNGSDSLFIDNLAMTLTNGLTWIPLYVALLYLVIKNNSDIRQILFIIAGAGLAAALPGVIAGETTLPVIGVPLECISEKSNGLGGMDSLLSIVQMPPQIPVATVGIGNAKNAGYLAVQILAIKYPELREKLKAFRQKLADDAKNTGLDVEL
jgi:phosphoribosylaminoimidazole carboxylase PurE protein